MEKKRKRILCLALNTLGWITFGLSALFDYLEVLPPSPTIPRIDLAFPIRERQMFIGK